MKIFTKLLILTILVGVLPLVAAGYLLNRESQDRLQLALQEMRTEKGAYGATLVDNFLRAVRKNVATTIYNADFRKPEQLEQLMNFLLTQYGELSFLTLLDKDANELVRAVTGLEKLPPAEYVEHLKHIRFDEALRSGRIVFSSAYRSPTRQETLLTMSLPLPNKTGVLGAEVSLKFIQSVVENIRSGPRGFALLLDENGRILAHRQKEKTFESLTASPFFRELVRTPVRGTAAFTTASGEEMIAASFPIRESPWILVVQEPKADVYASAVRMRHITILGVVASIIIALIGGTFLSIQITKPVSQLVSGAEELGKGHYDHKIEVDSTDEIGLFAKEFESMRLLVKQHIDHLDELVRQRTRELEEANEQLAASRKEIKDIMDNIQQAILTVNAQAQVNQEHSRYTKTVYGVEVAGKRFADLLAPNDPESPHIEEVNEWLELLFDQPDLDWDMLEELAVKEIDYPHPGNGQAGEIRNLEFDYHPIMKADNVESLMVITRDVTETRRLKKEVVERTQENEDNIAQIAEIIQLDSEIFFEFMAEAQTLIVESKELLVEIEAGSRDPDLLNSLFRKMHTLKGNAGAFKLTLITRTAHHVEDELDTARSEPDSITPEWIQQTADRLGELDERLEKAKFLAQTVTGRRSGSSGVTGDGRTIRVPRTKIDRMMQLVSAFGTDDLAAGEKMKVVMKELEEAATDLRRVPAGDVLEKLRQMVDEMATKLGKKINALAIRGEDIEIDIDLLGKLRDCLVHLLRNSIDHGIEPIEERQAHQKPGHGNIELRLLRGENQLTIEVVDDGKGIDIDRVREKAIGMSLISEQEAAGLSEGEIIDLIFRPGFSSAESVTDLSGRGVGLDAVKDTLTTLGGVIETETALGQGTTFRLLIPIEGLVGHGA